MVGTPFFTTKFSKKKDIPVWKMIAEIIRACTGVIDIYASQLDGTKFLVLSMGTTAFNTMASVMEQQARATLMSHFALQNNFADCAAKESNQDRGVKGIKVLRLPMHHSSS